ncbi:hypothetical protein M885DRAFT_548322 [Pelagophyceae sp. CCMP2097]|nr:hypothetical protein M885DRAFT_548322 [Pelagophyceae sp. CCMP2097]
MASDRRGDRGRPPLLWRRPLAFSRALWKTDAKAIFCNGRWVAFFRDAPALEGRLFSRRGGAHCRPRGPNGLFSGPNGLFSGPNGLFSGPNGLFSGPFQGPELPPFRTSHRAQRGPGGRRAPGARRPQRTAATDRRNGPPQRTAATDRDGTELF